VTILFGRASRTGVTKGATGCKIFFEVINIKIFIKKGLNYKNSPSLGGLCRCAWKPSISHMLDSVHPIV
jgi:hypothetical protein